MRVCSISVAYAACGAKPRVPQPYQRPSSSIAPNLLVVGTKPGNGKGNRCGQIGCGGCSWGLVCYVLVFWELVRMIKGFAFTAYVGEGQSTEPWCFAPRLKFAVALDFPNTSGHKTKTKVFSKVSRLDSMELKEGNTLNQIIP